MKKRLNKLLIYTLILVVISITSVYAITIIKASDVIYDNSKSGGSSSNVQGAIDELYEISDGGGGSGSNSNRVKLINENIITYVTDLAKTDTINLSYDDTADKNLRYIGANPNNYVEFNGELWRIIGVMNNVKDSKGNSTSRIKLIRSESIGIYSWDNKPNGTGSSKSPKGSNEWSDSRLMTTLNSGPYWNRTSGTCYLGDNGVTEACDFSKDGLTNEAKTMISSVVWNLGYISIYQDVTNMFYIRERGTESFAGRATKWTGYVGLMYPSDYGYATNGGLTTNRNTCLNTSVFNLNNSNVSDCKNNNWLHLDASGQWSLTPVMAHDYCSYAVQSDGKVFYHDTTVPNAARPVVYLDTKLYVTKGEGTETNPYKISFEKETSKDTSNASPPKLDENGKLIPATLADDGKVTMVSKDDEEWYNYSEKRWANAVILNDSPSQTYKIGDTIKESDIESYFVWIPKYKYKLWNTGTASKNAHEIDIIFDTKDTTDIEGKSCKTPMTSGATGNCNNGEYMTHPAFITLGVNGFWVGKFETGYKGVTNTEAAQVNSSDSSKIIIKPNVYSWRGNTIYNFFVSAYNYERSLDSHMMKNTEWGAVAYLSHSKYGINREVNLNNNSSYKTGYSALPSTNQQTYPGTYGDGATFNQAYNTSIGYLASTTGNISGVYDMSGGAYKYMASYISGKPASSGFTTATLANYNAKYFDVYNENSAINTYQYRILGDATGEMGPFQLYKDGDNSNRWHNSWYGDNSYFVESTYPWFHRGGPYDLGVLVGQFYFHGYTGSFSSDFGSRIVLTG